MEGQHEYLCAFYNKNRYLVEIVQKLIADIFSINARIEKLDNVWGIRVRSLNLYLFLTLMFNVPTNQVNWDTPNLIAKSSKENICEYISGFWDAEGTCSRVETFDEVSSQNSYVAFNQKNKESLVFIKSILEKEGIKCGNVCWNGHVWIFKISTRSIPKFANYLKSRHPIKSERLKYISRCFLRTECGQGYRGSRFKRGR